VSSHRHLGAAAWLVGLIGCTSPLGCFLAEAASQARLLANGARQGLLPSPVAYVRPGTQTPVAAIGLYVALTLLLCAAPAFVGASPILVFTVEAGVGTVPILLVYLLAGLALPLYMWRACRPLFRPLRHLLLPMAGVCALLYGIAAFLQPSQPAPGDLFWLETGGLLACSVACAIVALARTSAAKS
jgi:amino acid transporter